MSTAATAPATGAALSTPRGRLPALAGALGLLVLLGLIYHRSAATLWDTWTTNETYSHGPLVLLVALFLVWRDRAALAALPVRPFTPGLLVVAIGCALHVLGVRADVFALQGWSLIVVLYGLALGLLGWPITRRLAFPIGFLVFMLTFPPLVVNHLSFALKEVAVALSTRAAEALGAVVVRSGMTLYLSSGELRIEHPCSGLRSLIALLATGALLAALQPAAWWRRALLFLSAIPIAVAANALRLAFLIVVAHYAGVPHAGGLLHDASGYAVYALALGGLLLVRRGLMPAAATPGGAPAPPAKLNAPARAWSVRNLAIAGALLAATAAYVALHPPLNLAAGRNVLRSVPETFGAWNGTELSFEDAVVDELQSDDLLVRRYERGADRVWLCVVYHQNRRYGAHDARLCYESQGYLVDHESTALVDDGSAAGLRVDRFIADRPHQRRLVYYWWLTRGLSTADRDAARGRMALLGALDNRSWGAFVRVETTIAHGQDAEAEHRLQEFASLVARDLPQRLDAVRPAAVAR